MTTAAHIWRRPKTGTREQQAIAAMREITRLELVLDKAVVALGAIEYRDDIPMYQMNRYETLKLDFAKNDLAAARAELQTILKGQKHGHQ